MPGRWRDCGPRVRVPPLLPFWAMPFSKRPRVSDVPPPAEGLRAQPADAPLLPDAPRDPLHWLAGAVRTLRRDLDQLTKARSGTDEANNHEFYSHEGYKHECYNFEFYKKTVDDQNLTIKTLTDTMQLFMIELNQLKSQRIATEKADQIKHEGFCTEKAGEKSDLERTIEDQSRTITTLTGALEALKHDVCQMSEKVCQPLKPEGFCNENEDVNHDLEKKIEDQNLTITTFAGTLEALKDDANQLFDEMYQSLNRLRLEFQSDDMVMEHRIDDLSVRIDKLKAPPPPPGGFRIDEDTADRQTRATIRGFARMSETQRLGLIGQRKSRALELNGIEKATAEEVIRRLEKWMRDGG